MCVYVYFDFNSYNDIVRRLSLKKLHEMILIAYYERFISFADVSLISSSFCQVHRFLWKFA